MFDELKHLSNQTKLNQLRKIVAVSDQFSFNYLN